MSIRLIKHIFYKPTEKTGKPLNLLNTVFIDEVFFHKKVPWFERIPGT